MASTSCAFAWPTPSCCGMASMVALARRHLCRCATWHLMVVDECAGEGEVPRRSGHSATALPDGRILVFGGVDETGAYRNDAFLVDPDRNRWLALKGGITRGAPPKPRAYHRFVNASPQDVRAYHVLQVDRRRPRAGCCLQTA